MGSCHCQGKGSSKWFPGDPSRLKVLCTAGPRPLLSHAIFAYSELPLHPATGHCFQSTEMVVHFLLKTLLRLSFSEKSKNGLLDSQRLALNLLLASLPVASKPVPTQPVLQLEGFSQLGKALPLCAQNLMKGGSSASNPSSPASSFKKPFKPSPHISQQIVRPLACHGVVIPAL